MRTVRQFGFYAKDRLGGGKIKQSIGEIAQVLKEPFSPSSVAYRSEKLEKLLQHATATVPFYQKRGLHEFTDFPVVRKNTIQKDFDAFRSEKFVESPLFKVSTSGSTGIPFLLYHNPEKRQRNTADVLHFMNQTGYRIGNALFELEVWRGHNKRAGWKNLVQNTIQFDVTKMGSGEIEDLLSRIKRARGPKNILGFASALESIAQEMERQDLNMGRHNLRGITANSEYLNPYTREVLERRFNTPVYSRYSSEEMGILAHQTENSGTSFQLNWASYIFEIMEMDRDIPAAEGQLGRLVVTDLYNHSMPLIRYDTSDVGMFAPDNSDNRYLSAVEGRKMDMVTDTSGTVLSSFVVYTLFYPYYHLLNQYQFIQEGAKEYTIKLNAKGPFDKEFQLVEAVKADFGQDARVNIIYVDEIPALASGKRRKVVNLYAGRA